MPPSDAERARELAEWVGEQLSTVLPMGVGEYEWYADFETNIMLAIAAALSAARAEGAKEEQERIKAWEEAYWEGHPGDRGHHHAALAAALERQEGE